MRAISEKMVPSVTSMPPQETNGNLQHRVVTKQAVSKPQTSTWDKICRWFKKVITWIKEVFSSDPSPQKKKIPFVKQDPPVIETSFLKPKDPAYNLKRMSEMTVQNAIPSLCTEPVFKALPRQNAIHLGYDDPVHYQTALGEKAIAAQTGLTALGIFGISTHLLTDCIIGKEIDESARAAELCINKAANFWQETPGQTFLAGSALLLGASLYAHNKGWLGALLHDRSLGWREGQVEALFKEAANELDKQTETDALGAKKTAKMILENSDLIEATLHVDLQLSREKAKKIIGHLKVAALRAVDEDLTQIQTTTGSTP